MEPFEDDIIRDALQARDDIAMVTSYLAVVEYLGSDGERRWQIVPGPGQDTGTCCRLAELAHRVADRWMDEMVDSCLRND